MDTPRQWAPPEAVTKEVKEFSGRTRQMLFGEISNDEFRQFRLERGVYGQRQPGVQMVRIKIPYGGLTAGQLACIAQITAAHGHGIAHLTTRQDIQLHYVKLSDIPVIMERLAEADITTREACGNTVRNVTACPFAGVCRDEAFDVTAHAHRTAAHLMRNPSTAGMGRKFKVSFSGCESACGLAPMHDIGLTAVERRDNGKVERGFRVAVGGGLGSAPKAAQVFSEFVPESAIIPIAEAITRVFFLYGERDRRMKARMKFLLEDIGIEEFRRLVAAELDGLPDSIPIDPLPVTNIGHATSEDGVDRDSIDPRWRETNVYQQRQPGFCAVTVRLLLGDIDAAKLAALAEISARFTNDIRITVEQNFLLRWIPESRLAGLHAALRGLGLVEPGAGRLLDITACPGADTCNLGITSSKGLARQFTDLLQDTLQRFADLNMRIKISGCPNSCGQHHIADVGFYGCSVKIGGRVAPAFQVMIGGHLTGRDASFAQPLMKIPARRLPALLETLLSFFETNRHDDEEFFEFVQRIGSGVIKNRLEPFALTTPTDESGIFTDWGGHSDFALNVKQGECAGVEVDLSEAILARAGAFLAEGHKHHTVGEYGHAAYTSFSAIIQAAKALLITDGFHGTSYHQIIREFAARIDAHPAWSATLPSFRDRLEEFKRAIPDSESSSSYLAFAESVVSLVHTRLLAHIDGGSSSEAA